MVITKKEEKKNAKTGLLFIVMFLMRLSLLKTLNGLMYLKPKQMLVESLMFGSFVDAK